MALTVSSPNPDAGAGRLGKRQLKFVTVTFDSDYLEGGEAFDPVQFGLVGKPFQVIPTPRVHARGPVVTYDRTNKTLVVFGNGGTSSSNVTAKSYGELCHCDLSALVCDITIVEGDGS